MGSKYFDFSLDYSAGIGQLASDNGSALIINRDIGTKSSFIDNYGILINSKQNGGIQLISENSTNGIKIDTRLNNSERTSTYMTFTPNGQGFSTFSITSGCGNIWSEKGGVSGYNGLKLSAFAAPWAIFPSVKPGTNRSIEAANDIFSNRNIQGNELYWINDKRDSHGWGTSSNNVWAHLDAIYGLIKTVRDDANNKITNVEKNAKTWAANAEKSAKDYTNSYAAPKNHSHNYASANHTHMVNTGTRSVVMSINYDTYQILGMDVSHIKKVVPTTILVPSGTTSAPV